MVRVLRRRKRGTRGLVLGNGGNVTYQHALVLSANPPAMGQEYPRENPLPKLLDVRGPAIDSRPEGKATIEVETDSGFMKTQPLIHETRLTRLSSAVEVSQRLQ